MDASEMNMVFYSSTMTPLWSTNWMPKTVGGYAGTCIFLVCLAIVFRGLSTVKSLLEYRWLDSARKRRYIVVADKTPASERISSDADSKMGVLTVNGVEESIRVVQQLESTVQPFRFSVDLPRAGIAMVQVGVGYLLMLAVMTLNVGYFMSVVGGAFIGELAFGRYSRINA